MGVVMKMYCDRNIETPQISFSEVNSKCQVGVKILSKHSCYAWTYNLLMCFIDNNSWVFGIFLIVMCLAVGMFCKKFFKPTMCMVGSLVVIVKSSLFLLSVFFDRDTLNTTEWIVFIVCIVVGVMAGLLLAFLNKFGIAVLGGWGGFCPVLILSNTVFYKIDGDGNIDLWCITIGLAIVSAILTLYHFGNALIIVTAITGSYALMRGISMFAGGYPDEIEVYYMIKMGQIDGM